VSIDLAVWREALDANPTALGGERMLVATARNIGGLRASLTAINVHVGVKVEESIIPVTMMGRNDFPYANPSLPHALEAGDQVPWLTALATIEMMRDEAHAAAPTNRIVEVWAEAQLGSGETIVSDRHSLALLPLGPVA
jgi:hypothetical protein